MPTQPLPPSLLNSTVLRSRVVWVAGLTIIDQVAKYTGQYISHTASLQPGLLGNIFPPATATLASCAVLGALIVYQARTSNQRIKNILTLVIAGGIGNTIDRLIYRSVVDIITISSLTFNLADTYILIGILLLLVYTGISTNTARINEA